MFFHTIDFALFLPIVFALYWYLQKYTVTFQNILLVIASYVFYGWWDYRFLALIAFSSILDYLIGIKLHKTEDSSKRKWLLGLSIAVNLGFLGVFKYYNFFIDSFVHAFSFFGNEINPGRLDILLPAGISFYTFQTLSYSIDIYKKKLEPSKDVFSFFAFVSFFPQLVAGPIERATNLLPQFYSKRKFDYALAVDGSKQILWGLFKKIVIADNCAAYANMTFNNPDGYTASSLVLGAIFFAFQIYGDFSGYSDIAIGTSRLFGFNLKQNFAFPYFSRDIAEFWRRWHMSLTTWFRDYLYIPLGGSRGGSWMKVRNTFIIFLVSGFWHGANWTFIVWGLLNAALFLPLMLLNRNRKNTSNVASGKILPSFVEFLQIIGTFCLTTFIWIFFRAKSLTESWHYVTSLFDKSLFSIPNILTYKMLLIIFLIGIFISIEWRQRENQHGLQKDISKYKLINWAYYTILVFTIFWLGGAGQGFIYFQF